MRMDQINVFLEIVKIRNLTKAAENLFMSQSAVSQQLKLLEEELGVQLIMRHKGQRTVSLTCHGEAFIPMAEGWVRLMQQTESLRQNAPLDITVGSVDSLNVSILSAVCQQMLQLQPAMNLRICTNQSAQLYKLADTREIDLGLVSYQASLPHITVLPVFEQKMCVIRNKAASTDSVTSPADLPADKEIRLNWGRSYLEWHDNWWNPDIHPHVITDSMILLSQFLQTPGCWAVVPAIDHVDRLATDLEICEFGPDNPPNRPLYLIMPDYLRPNRQSCVSLFLDTLEQFVQASAELVWNYRKA